MSTQNQASAGYHNLYDNPRFSDVVIKFHDQKIHAHKSIIVSNCEYFYKAFTGGFKVANSNEIDLGDDDRAEVVRAAIRHLYNLPYDLIDHGSSVTTAIDLPFHIDVFAIADKYDIPTLRSLVVNKFKYLLSVTWENPQFAPAMTAVCFSSAPKLADESLRAAAAEFCAEKAPELMEDKTFVALLEEEEPFASQMLSRAVTRECKHCKNLKVCWSCQRILSTAILKADPTICRDCGCVDGHDTGLYYGDLKDIIAEDEEDGWSYRPTGRSDTE